MWGVLSRPKSYMTHPGGRPTNYTEELGQEICQNMIEGKSLARVCKELEINYRTVFNWLKDKDKSEFLQQYMHARAERADFLADDILDIADDNTLQADDRRIRIDARKWYAGKLKPKKYGDKLEIGGDEDKPIIHEIRRTVIDPRDSNS